METKKSARKMQHVNGEMPSANACRHESQFTISSVIMWRLLKVKKIISMINCFEFGYFYSSKCYFI